MNGGYWQLYVDPDDREKTTFITQDGPFEFVRMPFGLTNAPATFQRAMDVVLGGLKYNQCLVYLDDIVVFANDTETHLYRLQRVLNALSSAGLTIKPQKCCFGLKRMLFLGHIVDSEGIRTNPSKTRVIEQFKVPKNITEIRNFMGLAGYHRKFIKDFSKAASPITDLTKLKKPLIWGTAQQQSFEKLKELLCNDPVLIRFDPHLPIELNCDASGLGIGGAPMHLTNKGRRSVGYVSRLLKDCETRYPILELEALVIVWSRERLKHFLQGIHFTIYTDHQSLCWMKKKDKLSGRLMRWSMQLQNYDFEIVYRAGSTNEVADFLSRNPDANETFDGDDDYSQFINATINRSNPNDDIRKLQRRDKELIKILQQLSEIKSGPTTTRIRKNLAEFEVQDGLLYRKIKGEAGPTLVLCIPKTIKHQILSLMHDDVTAGHLGLNKTLAKT